MAIDTTCTGCSRRLRVADEHAGRRARCPHCGHVYEVPKPRAADSPSYDSSTPAPGPQPVANAAPSEPAWRMMTEDGQVYGPVPRRELDSWVTQGRVTANSRLQRDGDSQWQRAAAIYASLEPLQTSSANPYAEIGTGHPTAGANAYAYASPGFASAPRYLPPHRGGLVLTLSILSWVFMTLCPVPLLAMISLVIGLLDLRSMRLGAMDPSGRGLTLAGVIISALQLILVLVLVAGFIILVIVADP